MKKLLTFLIAGMMVLTAIAGCNPTGEQGEGGGSGQEEEQPTPQMPAIFRREADYSPRNGEKREWNDVSSYFCNYGQFDDEMAKYDVAIINADSMGQEGIRKLKEAGVWVIAYITLGEDYACNVGDGLGPGGYASYYLYDDNDMAIPNGDWGSYYVDPGHPAWQQITLNEVQRLIDLGADGIFMDTVDSVDRFPETLNSMYHLMTRIREEFPDIKMVLNRGFTVVPTLYEILDGVMYELYSTALDRASGLYDMLDPDSVQFTYNRYYGVAVLNACRQKHYFPVFAFEYYRTDGGLESIQQMIYDTDWEYDFIPYLNMAGRAVGGNMMSYEFRPKSERGIKALSLRDEAPVEPNGDISEANLAYAENGAKIEVDSMFAGYDKQALNDGILADDENFEALGWQFANWASAETDTDHYVQITLPEAKTLQKLTVYWAYDNGDYYASRKVSVQVEKDGEWVTVATVSDITDTVSTEIALTGAENVTKVRLLQERGFGPAARRNIMWLTEIALY